MTQNKNAESTNALATTGADAALAAFGGFDSLIDKIEGSQQQVKEETASMRDGSVTYAKFLQRGEEVEVAGPPDENGNPTTRKIPWACGMDNETPITPEDVFVIDPTTFVWGKKGWQSSGTGGPPKKGEDPDSAVASVFEAIPSTPADKPWVNKFCTEFRALCIKSDDEELLGQVVEFSIHQGMQEGFKDAALKLRDRALEAKRRRDAGDVEGYTALMANIYPVVRFDFKLSVKTKYKPTNKPILVFENWTTREQNLDAPQAPAEGSVAEEAEKAKATQKPKARRRRE